jgi:hypothetical protein
VTAESSVSRSDERKEELAKSLLLLRNTDDFAANVIENGQVLGAQSSVPPVRFDGVLKEGSDDDATGVRR